MSAERAPQTRFGAGYAEIDGLPIDRIRHKDVREAIRRATNGGQGSPPFQVATVNLDFLAQARRDPAFRRALHGCSLTIADGMPIVWLSRCAGSPLPERVTGADLTAWLLDGGVPTAGLFLLGATQGVLAAARARAEAHGARVVGTASPDRSELTSTERSAKIVADINASGANILLVALGAPLQETWTARWRASLDVAVAIGVGCSLDVAAGAFNRAPEPWQRLGLEWLYRLWKEPARLWRRYVLRDLPYLVSLAIRTFLARIRGTAVVRKGAA